ncbi:MAG: winged helix-turn-helix transcriptional regulator [Deltaproteobacteria bacterium]|nr:winged helix-turn-helix transcriptional regulator [Deltaproteobacteria bacterium]
MNDAGKKSLDTHRFFQLLSEIEQEESVSQRELASRLGIALGLVNSYLKNLVAKGYIRIKAFPRNRYGYLLTPQGLAEKSRLAYQHLSYFTNLYQTARQDYLVLFRTLHASGIRRVSFCGVDETAEIAYLSLRETGLELAEVMDDQHTGENFFEKKISPLLARSGTTNLPIIITSLKRGDALEAELLRRDIKRSIIFRAGNGQSFSSKGLEDL